MRSSKGRIRKNQGANTDAEESMKSLRGLISNFGASKSEVGLSFPLMHRRGLQHISCSVSGKDVLTRCIHRGAAASLNSAKPTPHPPPKGKGKGKKVHYADEPPAPPGEVLDRSGTEVNETSAGAAVQATAENQVAWGDVIMRGTFVVY